MLFLRARYYEPGTGRFISRDPWSGNIQQPLTLHGWSYVQNDPVGLVDPSGWQTPVPEPVPTPSPPGGPQPTPTPTPQLSNHRDLTEWLYAELHQHANGYYARCIQTLLNSQDVTDQARAYIAWILLVKDRVKWDFKHGIRAELDDSIVLRHEGGYRWYEFSVPGNVFYAFVGRSAGFSGFKLHAGASVAEVIDPAHASDACCLEICEAGLIELDQCISLGCYYINPDWWQTGFDEPGDWQNVEFGIQLFNAYGPRMTFEQFQSFLANRGHSLTPAAQTPDWNWTNPNPGWPYGVGRFNGPKEAQYELPIQLLLLRW